MNKIIEWEGGYPRVQAQVYIGRVFQEFQKKPV